MTYPAHLYRECEQRSAKEQADKVGKVSRPQYQTVKQPPSNTRAAPHYLRMGVRA